MDSQQQIQPYWVQIELEPAGQKTACMQIDLNKVQRFHLIRVNGEPQELKVRYADEVIVVGKEAINSFVDKWYAYQVKTNQLVVSTDPERAHSNIMVPDNHEMRLNPKFR
jgi:hypothetical protein